MSVIIWNFSTFGQFFVFIHSLTLTFANVKRNITPWVYQVVIYFSIFDIITFYSHHL